MKKILLLLQIFLMTSCTVLLAQQTVIKGKVTDNSGGGLPGVNVVLKGNTSGTSTDQNGDYSLALPNGATGEQTLVFSFIGYIKQEIAIANRTVIDVKLLVDTQNLDEVVVVGYGTTAKKNLTTAISKVDPTKIPTSANNNVSELLFGRAAGLQVTQQSSQPGGNISVSIRGKGNPLLVIDGVVYPGNSMEPGNGSVEMQGVNRGGLAGLNPSDIESIEFLKDASAAIYGVSAANGVIVDLYHQKRKSRPHECKLRRQPFFFKKYAVFETIECIGLHALFQSVEQRQIPGRPQGIWRRLEMCLRI